MHSLRVKLDGNWIRVESCPVSLFFERRNLLADRPFSIVNYLVFEGKPVTVSDLDSEEGFWIRLYISRLLNLFLYVNSFVGEKLVEAVKEECDNLECELFIGGALVLSGKKEGEEIAFDVKEDFQKKMRIF